MDIFAAGCILAELYIMRPLFPGTSEMDQLIKICQTMGTPSQSDWAEGYKLAQKLNFNWPKFNQSALAQLIPTASPEAIDLM